MAMCRRGFVDNDANVAEERSVAPGFLVSINTLTNLFETLRRLRRIWNRSVLFQRCYGDFVRMATAPTVD